MNPTITPLDEETRQRIIKRMMKEHQFSEELASAILDETLVFMHASISNPGIGPSKLVDHGWHTFILYTMEYSAYCHQAFGRYLHHNPTDREGEVGTPLSETLDFFRANGISFDPELWGWEPSAPSAIPVAGVPSADPTPRVRQPARDQALPATAPAPPRWKRLAVSDTAAPTAEPSSTPVCPARLSWQDARDHATAERQAVATARVVAPAVPSEGLLSRGGYQWR